MYATRGDAIMAERGRKKVFQSKEEWAVVVSLRVPRDVYDQVQRYLKMHPRMTLTEFILDGIRLRLETPADPRDIVLSDDNTVVRELQEMIRTQVQAEIGKLQDFMGSAFDALKLAPAPEAAAEVIPVPGYEGRPGHSVVTEDVPTPEAAEPVSDMSYDSNTVLQERAGQTTIPWYNTKKYMLGEICRQRHDYHGTGQSLRQRGGKHECVECKNARNRAYKKRQRQGEPA
jgi:hypothetical protein